MKIFIFISFLFISQLLTAQEVLYISIFESIRSMEIEVITPADEIQTTYVKYTPNDDVKVTFPDKTVKYFKDKSMSLSIIVKRELEKWIKNGFEIKTSNTFFNNETISMHFPEKSTVYVLVKERDKE